MCMANTWNSWSARQEGQRGTVSIQQQKKKYSRKNIPNAVHHDGGFYFGELKASRPGSDKKKQQQRDENGPSQTQTQLLCGQTSPVYCQTNGTWRRHLRHDTSWQSIVCTPVLSVRWTLDAAVWCCWVQSPLGHSGWKVKWEKALMQLHCPLMLVNWKALFYLLCLCSKKHKQFTKTKF